MGIPRPRFGVTATFAGERVVLAARGEVDVFAAPMLGAFIDAAIASGYLSIVVDLADVEDMDAPAMAVVARAARRLAAFDGQLTVRASAAVAGHISAIAGPANWLMFEPTDGVGDVGRFGGHLGEEEESTSASVTPAGDRSFELVQALSHMSAVQADQEVVDAALALVVALARATVGGADGVSVSLRRHGVLATVAASDQTIMDMDTDQYATGEGPCVDASVEGHWSHIGSLDTETRWPAFIPKARALGINAILSIPLLGSGQPIGALNIYSRTAEAFAPRDQELAAVFATEASIVLTDATSGASSEQLATRLGAALHTRQIIAQAQGVVMEREHISADAAYRLLANFSQSSNRPLLERAEDVVASTQYSLADRGTEPVRILAGGPAGPAHKRPVESAPPERGHQG